MGSSFALTGARFLDVSVRNLVIAKMKAGRAAATCVPGSLRKYTIRGVVEGIEISLLFLSIHAATAA